MLWLLAGSGLAAAADPTVTTVTDQIVVDGRLDEAGWSMAVPVTDFRRYLPNAGGPPDGETEVRFLQDDAHLYIGITVRDLSYRPRARVSPREDINDDDQVGIYLDTYDDGRTGYIFYFNPLGIQQDIRYANGDWFVQWDTVYTSEGQVTDDGFTIEVAMPFRSIRYPAVGADAAPQTWRVMITRKLPHEGTKYAFPQLQRGHPRMFLQAAPLRNVQPARRGAGLWIQPVLAVRHQMTDEDEDGTLTWTGAEPLNETIRPGLDLRFGITPDIGAALTINPDFSQVEADVQIVNLNQRFAFFFPEQRPFFLDGVDAFADQMETLYTRSVVSPLYGAKVSGMEGPLSIGVLQSIDVSPAASVHETGTPGFSEDELENAWTSNSFARLRLDAFGSGYVGLTAADKRVLGEGTGFNDVLAGDISVPFNDVWTAEAAAGVSSSGNADTRLRGGQAQARLVRSPELGLGMRLSGAGISEGFRQEMGFLNLTGLSRGSGSLDYTFGSGRTTWAPGISGSFRQEQDGDQRLEARHEHDATVAGIHNINLGGAMRRWRQDGAAVPGWVIDASWRAQLSRLLTLSASSSHGVEIDFQELVPAQSTFARGGGSVRPTRGTRLDLDVVQQWFTPEGLSTAQATRMFSRFTWQFLRPLGMRLNQQTTIQSDAPRETQASALLIWLESPGREIYLGGTWGMNEEDGLTEQTLFVKATWLVQM
ncbi:MAG: DUF5916 domain-containing protein [Myxococcota bacterium]